MNKIEYAIFLGGSHLLYKCARKIKNYYGADIRIKIIDVSNSTHAKKKKLQEEFDIVDGSGAKERIFEYLNGLEENTVLFSIANPMIIPSYICDKPNLILINLHHALLPNHPGRNAATWAIFDQDKLGGITWHFINAGIDTGDILLQKSVEISEDITAIKLIRVYDNMALEIFDNLLPLERISELPVLRQKYESRGHQAKSKDVPNNGIMNLEWDVLKSLAFLNSMNYGALNLMGKPRVKWMNRLFVIENYSIMDSDTDERKTVIYMDEKNKVLFMKDNIKQLKIMLREEKPL